MNGLELLDRPDAHSYDIAEGERFARSMRPPGNLVEVVDLE